MSNAAKNFDILASSLSVLHNYFDSSKLLFWFVSSYNFRFFSKIVFFVYLLFWKINIKRKV